MTAVSVDLAYKSYSDFGVAILEPLEVGVRCEFLELTKRGGSVDPAPAAVAEYCIELCEKHSANLLLLDGPQAWKDPDNGLEHSRVCERLLNTPAKTGVPGHVKPRNYAPFVIFSITVFDELAQRGWPRLDPQARGPSGSPAAIESFPLGAWRALGIPVLPAKRRASVTDVRSRFQTLCDTHLLRASAEPNHDQLQALVAGLAGVALEQRRNDAFAAVGVAPRVRDGVWREGYILNPAQPWQPVAASPKHP